MAEEQVIDSGQLNVFVSQLREFVGYISEILGLYLDHYVGFAPGQGFPASVDHPFLETFNIYFDQFDIILDVHRVDAHDRDVAGFVQSDLRGADVCFIVERHCGGALRRADGGVDQSNVSGQGVDIDVVFQDVECRVDGFEAVGFFYPAFKEEKQGMVADVGSNVENAAPCDVARDCAVVPFFADKGKVVVLVVGAFGENPLLDVVRFVEREVERGFLGGARENISVLFEM